MISFLKSVLLSLSIISSIKSMELEQSIPLPSEKDIPLKSLPSSFDLSEFAVYLLAAESTFKEMQCDQFEQYENIYLFLKKQTKFRALDQLSFEDWVNLFKHLELLGFTRPVLDAVTRYSARCHTKTVLEMRKDDFDKLLMSKPTAENLGKWLYRDAFKQELLCQLPEQDNNDPYLLDEMVELYPPGRYLSFLKLLVFSAWPELRNYYRGKSFCKDIQNQSADNEDDMIVAKTLEMSNVSFDYNLEKFFCKTSIVRDLVETIKIKKSVLQAQKGLNYFYNVDTIILDNVQFPNGIHPEIFKNVLCSKITINNSNVTTFPKGLFKTNNLLTELNFKNNQLTSLDPQLFEKTTDLKQLYLDGNPWDPTMDWQTLPDHAKKAAHNTGFFANKNPDRQNKKQKICFERENSY